MELLEGQLGNAKWWNDGLLKHLTDQEGFLALSRMAQFPKFRSQNFSAVDLQTAATSSPLLELSPDGEKVRWREGRRWCKVAEGARRNVRTPRFRKAGGAALLLA